ncbi:MAG: 50S ribosomal protein L31e [ANME-2 cluster archaeon]|nr:50S ribosomal protein L31e [ANME-2 cluster archaeon]
MVEIGEEHVYTIPLRGAKNAPRWERSKKAVKEVFKYLEQHTKTDRKMIKVDPKISEKIWERGSEKPPSKIRVKAMKFEDGIVEAELAAK